MCGRYYVDDDTAAREIEKLVRQVDEKLRRKDTACRVKITTKNIHPTDAAPILAASDSGIACLWQRWGFPGFKKGQVVFNARCESAQEKSMFREGILHHRAVIPAAGFYAWDHERRKYIFYRDGEPVLYLAGGYRKYGDGDRFGFLP